MLREKWRKSSLFKQKDQQDPLQCATRFHTNPTNDLPCRAKRSRVVTVFKLSIIKDHRGMLCRGRRSATAHLDLITSR